MTETMIDRLARAAQEEMLSPQGCLTQITCSLPPCKCSQRIVRAILQELAEPSEEMVDAGRSAARAGGLLPAYTDESVGSKMGMQPPIMHHIIQKHIWPAMISAITDTGEKPQ